MSKIKTRWFTIADYEDEENWLREQHRQGLKMVKFVLPCFYVFEECAPEDVVYRLDYKNAVPDSGYMQLFKDYGWEYLETHMGWLYFRKPASAMTSEEDGEIFSDNASKLDMLDHIFKTRMLPIIVIFASCCMPNALRALTRDFGIGGNGIAVFFLVLTAWYIYLSVHCGTKLARLRKRFGKKD